MRPLIVPTTSGGVTRWISSFQARWHVPFGLSACFGFCFAGAPLWQILAAGEWRSPAFMEYLDKFQLETDIVVQAHVGESEDEEGV